MRTRRKTLPKTFNHCGCNEKLMCLVIGLPGPKNVRQFLPALTIFWNHVTSNGRNDALHRPGAWIFVVGLRCCAAAESKPRRKSLQNPVDERCSVRPVAGCTGFSSKLVGAQPRLYIFCRDFFQRSYHAPAAESAIRRCAF